MEHLNRSKEVLHEPFFAEKEEDNIQVEVALQYNDGFASNIYPSLITLIHMKVVHMNPDLKQD
ncbi:DNA gyrase subunit B [Gracilibacillus boraciitolerans JCM 21714]|uniref:DNA gyrase subunit B n=1 Tax=Gracilibacillus boraciitolerans JCM 21714 TaxID=1298598 RepID=W4VKY7_9BACI|nr:DNA gyrase subunit B [Gracilibacillus boraciitolerans JCM 21714]